MNERNNRGVLALAVIAVAAVLIVAVAMGRPVSVNATSPDGSNTTPTVGITVSGDGVVHAVPNLAYVDFGVQGNGSTVEAARSEAAAAADRVLAALRAGGVVDADISTTGISLYPQYPPYPYPYPCPVYYAPTVPVAPPDPGNSGSGGVVATPGPIGVPVPCDPNKPQEPSGWTYAQTFEVTIRDINQTGVILDAATQAGVNQINGIRFDLANRDTLTDQARDLAVKAARAKAEAMTKSAGVGLGIVLSISETSSMPPSPIWYGAAKDSAGSVTTPVAPGTLDVTVTVTMSFALVQ